MIWCSSQCLFDGSLLRIFFTFGFGARIFFLFAKFSNGRIWKRGFMRKSVTDHSPTTQSLIFHVEFMGIDICIFEMRPHSNIFIYPTNLRRFCYALWSRCALELECLRPLGFHVYCHSLYYRLNVVESFLVFSICPECASLAQLANLTQRKPRTKRKRQRRWKWRKNKKQRQLHNAIGECSCGLKSIKCVYNLLFGSF